MNKLEERFDKIIWSRFFHENDNKMKNGSNSVYKTLAEI